MEDGVSTVFLIPFFNLPVTNVVIMSWIAMAVIIFWAFLATRNMKDVPGKLQNTAEIVVEFINNFVSGLMNKENAKVFAPYVGTVGLFLVIANTVGALFASELTGGVIAPPARTLGVPLALALMTIILAVGAGIWRKGLTGYIKKLFKPLPFLFPFNLLELITKPLSLSMRLFGNILGAYILMELLVSSTHVFFPSIACLYFDLFDGLLQAYVFILLTSLYVAEEVNEGE